MPTENGGNTLTFQCSVWGKEMRTSQDELRKHWSAMHQDRMDWGENPSHKLPSEGSRKDDQSQATRRKVVGMNLFRKRYLGIKQSVKEQD